MAKINRPLVMNLQSFRRITPALAILVIALILITLPRLDALFFADLRYDQCRRMIATDPSKALAFAKAWKASHPASPLAGHCEALALFATRDYSHAAEEFVGLAREAQSTNPSLSAELTGQAMQAYEAAGQTDMAKALSPDINQQNASPHVPHAGQK